jgi:regulator of sirC expression with transglutaminase-like and TPR domain
MTARVNLTLFAHVCARPEAELDLAQAALLLAEAASPGLDVARYLGLLDELGRRAAAAVSRAAGDEDRVERVVGFFYGEAGFRGNDEDYYDPRNSFLNDVLDRRTGIPISLAVVLTEVCRRAGVDARGVSFPGHFLVRCDTARGAILIDPFAGRAISRDDLRALHARATGEDRDPSARLLEPATKPQILLRMLNNLKGIYESKGDGEHLRTVLERIQVLAPTEALRRHLEKVGGSEPWRPGGAGLN